MRLDLANARIGARRSRLLGREGLLDILSSGSTKARLDLVRARAAAGEVPPASAAPGLAAVEAALRRRLRAEADEILEAVEGARPRALLAAWLELDEAEAVKAVVRGLLGGTAVDDVLAAAPVTPRLPAGTLRAALARASVDSALSLLSAAGSAVAAAAMEAWSFQERARPSLLPVEIAVDRAALERAFRQAEGRGEDTVLLRAHLADRVDGRNAGTLLALGSSTPAEDPFLPRGRRLPLEALGAVVHRPFQARQAFLAGRLGIGVEALATATLADLALERAAIVPLRREARRRPLSLAVPLAYLAERRAEVRRIALALRGGELGLPGDELLAFLEA